MDPLSIVSAAAALVQTIDGASQVLRSISDADLGRKEAERSLKELQITLMPLQDYLRSPYSSKDGAHLRALIAECYEQSQDLMQLLDKINAEDARQGTSHKLRRALRTQYKRKEVERRSRELSNLQQRLQLFLLHNLNNQSSMIHDAFGRMPIDSGESTATMEDRIAAIHSKLSRDVEVDEETATTKTAARDDAVRAKMIAGLESAKAQIAEATKAEEILKSLCFPDMALRSNQVSRALMHTCTWIFDESRTSFADWLRHGSGVFYISGKPGSGKSTLMHSLTTDPRTHDALVQWSSNETPVIASFYFWLAGSHLQRSRQGLFMSLLYQICRASPELAAVLFPNRWKEFGPGSKELASQNPWSMTELKEAAIRLEQATNSTNTQYCIFVDALDECEDGAEEVLKDIIDLSRLKNVKLCVSGRPYVFNSTFRNQTGASGVVMEDYNIEDIHRYIYETLREKLPDSISSQSGLLALADQIEQKSEGVFLWVYLTLRSMEEGIHAGDDVQTLQRRIDEMPSALAHLYDRMLGSINKTHESKMAKLLLLMLANDRHQPLPVMAAHYALHHGTKRSTHDLNAFVLSAEDRREQVNFMEDYILNNSAGLLLVTPGRITWALKGEDSAISFSHRSILDFFEQPDVFQRLELAVPKDFDPTLALCHSHIDWIEALDDASALDRTSPTGLFADIAKQVIEHMRYVMKRSEGAIRQTHRLADRLDAACSNIWQRSGSRTQHWSTVLLYSNDQQPTFLYSDFTMLMASAGINPVVENHLREMSKAQFKRTSPYLLAAILRLTHETLTGVDEDVQPLLSRLIDMGADVMAEVELKEDNTISAITYQDSVYNIFYLCASRGMNSWRYRETHNYIFSRIRQSRAVEFASGGRPRSPENDSMSKMLWSSETLISEQTGGLTEGVTKFLVDSIARNLSEGLLIEDAIREEQQKAASAFIKYSALLLGEESSGSRVAQAVAFLQNHHKDIALRTFELAVLNDRPPTLRHKVNSWQMDQRRTRDHERTAESDLNQLSLHVTDTFQLNGLVKECPGLPGIYASIKSSDAYKWLAARFLEVLSNDWRNCEVFLHIRDSILTLIDRDESSPQSFLIPSLELDWDIASFIQSQYKSQSDFSNYSHMPVLCGTFPDVEFLSLLEYLQLLWPQVSSTILEFLGAYVQAYRSKASEAQISSAGTTLTAYLTPQTTFLRLAGPLLTITQVAEALVWLGAVCRISPSPDSIAHCRPTISLRDQHCHIRYSADVLPESVEDDMPEEDGDSDVQRASCWRKMLRNPTVAQGYPIPLRRQNERGLGIGLNALSVISCAPLLTRFDGKLLMKGAVSMLVPVVQTAGSIVWHFILATRGTGKAREWLPYSAIDSCEAIIVHEDEEVLKCRHFVGWTTQAQHRAGTSQIDYRSVNVSECLPPGPGLVLSSLSISGGQYVTGGAAFAPGEAHRPLALDPAGFYESRITAAANWVVVFYNPVERRAWLLDGATSLLYLTRLWASQNTETCKGKDVGAGVVEINQAGVLSATSTLMSHKNRRIKLFPKSHSPLESEDEIIIATGTPALGPSDEWWLLGDQIEKIQETMGRVRGEMMNRYAKNKLKISILNRTLEGFEAIHMLGSGSFYPKAAKLKSGATDWLALTKDPSVSAICIFGTSIGDLIGNSNDPCFARGQVPVNQDYLTAPIPVVRSLSTAWNSHGLQLSSKSYLPYPVPALEVQNCSKCAAGRCLSPLVSELHNVKWWHSEKPTGKVNTIYNLPAGAIVIGGSHGDRLKAGWQKLTGSSARGLPALQSNSSTTSLDDRSQSSASSSTQVASIWSVDVHAQQASTAGSQTDISQISRTPNRAMDGSKSSDFQQPTRTGSSPSKTEDSQSNARAYLAEAQANLTAYLADSPISLNLLITVIIAASVGIFIGLAI